MDAGHHMSGTRLLVARVLIVDDDRVVRLILKRLLANKLGREVKEAGLKPCSVRSMRSSTLSRVQRNSLRNLRAEPELTGTPVATLWKQRRNS
jgi:CheY-like chemotaxis protein